jgi:hypothetical protein
LPSGGGPTPQYRHGRPRSRRDTPGTATPRRWPACGQRLTAPRAGLLASPPFRWPSPSARTPGRRLLRPVHTCGLILWTRPRGRAAPPAGSVRRIRSGRAPRRRPARTTDRPIEEPAPRA